MDKRAAEQYLDRLFGKRAGHVAAAYKDKTDWQEVQFAWPAQRTQLLAWAEQHSRTNVFVCPALRQDGHTRKKGNMQPTRWLWADVDWDKVPADKVKDVRERIGSLGTLVVASGSNDNAHVYVELSTPVPHEDFIKLNTGLRDYLFADAKQADNSLLRLPGTTNWKTGNGSPVAARGGHGRTTTKAALLKIRAFRDAKVIHDAEANEWSFVEIDDLPRRVRALINMPVDEAEGRYGNRHKAVWAITGDLIKDGRWNTDQIHSMMDRFPAALSKAADENGYDVHRDVDKRIAYGRATEALTDEEQHEIEDEAFELASDEDDINEYRTEVHRMAQAEMMRSEARKLARTMEAERAWVGPPDDVSWSLTDALRHPPQPVPHLIAGLVGARHNVVLTAQYKTGKTAFTMGSIASSLVDGKPFLDKFEVTGQKVVGHWNCEMDPAEMMDDYMRPVGIEDTDSLHVANLRGYSINLLTPLGKSWAVNWLRTRGIEVWTIDSFARLARMAGIAEKDNDEVMSLLMTLDEIKVEADVEVLFLITHTGRAEQEEGKERARGATAIDDWADARWIMTKMDKARFLRVEGRGVALDDTVLIFDEDTKRCVVGFGGKAEVKAETGKDLVVQAVKQSPGINKTELTKALRAVGMSGRAFAGFFEDAIEGGFIEIREESSVHGKRTQRHYLTGSLQGTDRRMRATPADVHIPPPRKRRLRVSDSE